LRVNWGKKNSIALKRTILVQRGKTEAFVEQASEKKVYFACSERISEDGIGGKKRVEEKKKEGLSILSEKRQGGSSSMKRRKEAIKSEGTPP